MNTHINKCYYVYTYNNVYINIYTFYVVIYISLFHCSTFPSPTFIHKYNN